MICENTMIQPFQTQLPKKTPMKSYLLDINRQKGRWPAKVVMLHVSDRGLDVAQKLPGYEMPNKAI